MRWPLGLYRVAGKSMQPTYQPGDVLLGWRWFRPQVGQIVVARYDGRPLIKRIARIERDYIHVVGDNSGRSTDSRHFGPLSHAHLEAKIILRLT